MSGVHSAAAHKQRGMHACVSALMSVCLFLHTPAGQAEACAGLGPAVRTVFLKKGRQGRGQMASVTQWDNAKGSQRGG